MADGMTFWDVLGQQGRGFSAEPDGTGVRQLMDFEVNGIQAGRHERSEARQTLRMGIRNDRCRWARWVRYRLRQVIFRHLEPRRLAERAQHPGSVDRRDVDAQVDGLVQTLGMTGIKSQSVRLVPTIDGRVKSFLEHGGAEWFAGRHLFESAQRRSGGVGAAIIASSVQPGQGGGKFSGGWATGSSGWTSCAACASRRVVSS